MKRPSSIALAALLFSFNAANAHTHLKSSMPADQAVLTSAPTEIMLHFSEPTRVTALSIQKEGEKQEKAVSTLPKTTSAAVSVPVQIIGPGKYKVNWRAMGADNHVMSGAVHFTIVGK